MSSENKSQVQNKDDSKKIERPIYTANNSSIEDDSDIYESPDCCFVRTFCCCIRDVPVKVTNNKST